MIFLVSAAVLFAWAFGAVLQWRNLRRQERVLAELERLRLRAARRAAREKAPRLESSAQREERIARTTFPLAG